MKENKTEEMFDKEDIRIYIKMSVKDKLNWLERFQNFLNKITPSENKKYRKD